MVKYIFIILVLLTNLYGFDKKKYEDKSRYYYTKYKEEYKNLPLLNKINILDSYYSNIAYDLGYTMAATRFLENRGMDTSYGNKRSIGVNKRNGYETYDCGDYGINTMTYLSYKGQKSYKTSDHIQACIELANDRYVNHMIALAVYEYSREISNGDTIKKWNVYNTGHTNIINDRIYQMKGIIMVLEEEIKKNKILDYKIDLVYEEKNKSN